MSHRAFQLGTRRRRCLRTAARTARALALTGLVTALVLTAAGCGGGSDDTGVQPAGTGKAAGRQAGDGRNGDGRNGDKAPDQLPLPDDLADRLKEHGRDLDRWKHGAWQVVRGPVRAVQVR